MPASPLDSLLTDTCTRRRYVETLVGGETERVHEDLAAIPCRAQPKSARAERRGYGVVPEAEFLVTLGPEADVRGPDPVAGVPGDVLMLTAGNYAGSQLEVAFVHERSLLPHRKAEAKMLDALPPSEAGVG